MKIVKMAPALIFIVLLATFTSKNLSGINCDLVKANIMNMKARGM